MLALCAWQEVAGDSEKQVQYLGKVMEMISNKEGGREDAQGRGLGS